MTLDQILRRLEDRNLAIVARNLKIHPNTLYGIASGKVKPSYQTLEKLVEYLNRAE